MPDHDETVRDRGRGKAGIIERLAVTKPAGG
ncbi:hypothetical protein SAMN05421810_11497 [Amycolatopsis arida]|uniref:Uncharacterized protein n=1 Tax=Amycolatopsis arida TaxID=587909 RepID=A0A1I6ATN9_9PSEU|nr:hypothetical protein CLV69_102630 [Amycolatopsis arida]SFQ72052.1 hypothetical protein SAMN05421810_11497 [Amycolatopsis arida]